MEEILANVLSKSLESIQNRPKTIYNRSDSMSRQYYNTKSKEKSKRIFFFDSELTRNEREIQKKIRVWTRKGREKKEQ